MPRWRMTMEQHAVLARAFDVTPFPTRERRDEIAALLGVEPRRVQVWFQNQRQRKLRTGKRQVAPEPCETSDDDEIVAFLLRAVQTPCTIEHVSSVAVIVDMPVDRVMAVGLMEGVPMLV